MGRTRTTDLKIKTGSSILLLPELNVSGQLLRLAFGLPIWLPKKSYWLDLLLTVAAWLFSLVLIIHNIPTIINIKHAPVQFQCIELDLPIWPQMTSFQNDRCSIQSLLGPPSLPKSYITCIWSACIWISLGTLTRLPVLVLTIKEPRFSIPWYILIYVSWPYFPA